MRTIETGATRELGTDEMTWICGGEDGGGIGWDYPWLIPVLKAVATAIASSSDAPYCGYACGKGA